MTLLTIVNHLLNVKTDEKCEWNFIHISASVNTENLKHLSLKLIFTEDMTIEELEEVVDEKEDEDIMVDEL